MKYKILLAVLLMTICACKTSSVKPIGKIEIVNPDYGILSVADKTRDGSRPLGWRCFPIKDIQVKYRTWRDADPLGPYDVIVAMCDFEILVNTKPMPNEYHGRRAKQVIYCDEFKAAWKKLTRGEQHVCLDGETLTGSAPEVDNRSRIPMVNWTWDKIKTKKGCYGFWDGYNC